MKDLVTSRKQEILDDMRFDELGCAVVDDEALLDAIAGGTTSGAVSSDIAINCGCSGGNCLSCKKRK